MTQGRSKVQITFAEDAEPLPSMEPEIQVRVPVWAWGAALAILTFITFAPTLPGKFLPQDDVNVTDNPLLRAWIGLQGVWRFAHMQPQVSPLGYTLLRCEYWLWTSRFAAGYHLVSLILHVANVLLVWTLLRKLDLRGAFVAAAIFAVHPVQVQTVAWISQQPALLGMVLGLMSLIVYLRFCGVNPAPLQPTGMLRLPEARWALYSIALALFLLAILAKPVMAVLPVVVLVLIWWDRGRIARGDWIAIAPIGVISLLTLIGGMFVARQDIDALPLSVIQRISIVGPALWFYLYSLVRPGTFSFVYPRWNPTAWWGWVMLLGVIGVIVVLWIRRGRWGRGPSASAMLFVAIPLPQILFVDVVQLREAYVADSVLYAALAAVSAGVVAALCEWLLPRAREPSPRLAAWIAGPVIVLAAGFSFWLAQSYRSPERLWAAAIARNPGSIYALNQLGMLEMKTQKMSPAMEHFRQALAIDPGDTRTMRNIGAYYEALRDPDRAYGQYFAAVNQDPTDVPARCGMARALAAKGDSNGAIREYENVLRYRPEYEIALNDMAMLYADLGRFNDALACYDRAIRAAPSYIPSHINLANLHFRMGNYQLAVDELARTQKIDPANFVVYVNIGAMCGQLSEIATEADQKKTLLRQSEMAFRQALYLNPDSAQAAHNLAVALARQASDDSQAGKLREAVFYFNKACMLEPENKEYAAHLREAQRQVATAPS